MNDAPENPTLDRSDTTADPSFETLLEYLKNVRGFDFTGYKRSSLMRRISGRMANVAVREFADYIDFLEVHPDEFTLLFNTILINVTAFFRDPPTWEYLSSAVIPKIIEAKTNSQPVRCWSAGCASGEEAYTLAMVLTEIMGADEFRKRVKIYATDVDEEALATARQAAYTDKDVQAVPESLRRKYFEVFDTKYVFRNDLRRLVIFGRHDLVQDAPISRLDLLIVRNTLMYFNTETQSKILSRLHFGLNPGGYLFLGKAEMLISHAQLFQPVDLKYRIFSKVHNAHIIDTYLTLPRAANEATAESSQPAPGDSLEALPVACITVDQRGTLTLANQRARDLFHLRPEDLGRPFSDLEISYRPVELRSVLDRVTATKGPVKLNLVEWKNPETHQTLRLDVQANPVVGAEKQVAGVTISFIDMTDLYKLQEEIRATKNELETTNEELHSSNEELETTNEELQSTVEELQTTNEELQSTNEEMETMNEELQATNEELQTTNDELRRRTEELDLADGFKNSIFQGIRTGVIVVDTQFIIQAWNHKVEDLWGINSPEAVGQSFFNLDIGLPVEDLREIIRNQLSGVPQNQETVLPSTNRRGKKFFCRVTCTPLTNSKNEIKGVILLMEEWKQQEEKELSE